MFTAKTTRSLEKVKLSILGARQIAGLKNAKEKSRRILICCTAISMRLSVIRIRFVQPFVLFELELVSAGGLGQIDVFGKAHMVHIVYASMERFAESSDIVLLSLIEELSALCIAFAARYLMRMIIYFEPFHSR